MYLLIRGIRLIVNKSTVYCIELVKSWKNTLVTTTTKTTTATTTITTTTTYKNLIHINKNNNKMLYGFDIIYAF